MKARILGTSSFVEIDKVQLKDSDILYSAEVMEFEVEQNFDYFSTKPKTNQQLAEADYWEKLRHQAAIATMQGILIGSHDKIKGESLTIIPKNAIFFADELIKQLKEK